MVSRNGTSQVWVRADFGKCFVTQREPMPLWDFVVRRVTINFETREVLEEIKVSEVSGKILHRPLPPGVNGIETWFYYGMGSTSVSAKEAQSYNSTSDGAFNNATNNPESPAPPASAQAQRPCNATRALRTPRS